MNKRLLLLTSAMGLVLTTAALAQSPSGSTTTTPPSQTPTTTSPPSSNSTVQTTPTPATAPTQAQPPAGTSSQVQTTNPPGSGQAQQAPASPNTTAQQPTQTNTGQTSTTNVNATVNINEQQRTQVTQSISRLNVQPLTNVNFAVSVGTVVPRDVRVQPLPADVVAIVPQYQGYNFFMVRDEIVIVEPSTYKIVTVLPRSGSATAAAPAPSHNKVTFTDKDREVIRKHTRARTEMRTTGSTARVEIRRGERLPDVVEMEAFPETVYRDAPTLRDYRYIHRENRTYLVNPSDRMVIEEID